MNFGFDSAEPPLIRHCALCLKVISGGAILKCGKCLKRAYCSKECQATDWSPKKNGQGHKNWCRVECGEEDVDWALCPIPGKGLGIVALRDLPVGYRIIVEPKVDKTHPRIVDLMPQNGSLKEKYDFNKYEYGEDDDLEEVLCLRVSRANHSCNPNAQHFYDHSIKVKILFALRDIKRDDEICISYVRFNDLHRTETPEGSRECLRLRWGIICDENCLCFDAAYCENIKKGRELDNVMGLITPLGSVVCKSSKILGTVKKCLRSALMAADLDLSVIIVKKTPHEEGYQVAVKEMNSFESGMRFLNEVYESAKWNTDLPQNTKGLRPFITWSFRVVPPEPVC